MTNRTESAELWLGEAGEGLLRARSSSRRPQTAGHGKARIESLAKVVFSSGH